MADDGGGGQDEEMREVDGGNDDSQQELGANAAAPPPGGGGGGADGDGDGEDGAAGDADGDDAFDFGATGELDQDGEPQVPPLFGDGDQQPAAGARPASGGRRKRNSLAGVVMSGIEGEDGQKEECVLPVEDGDDWSPNEVWKEGQWGVVNWSEEKIESVFRQHKDLEWDEKVLDFCGRVGEVMSVTPDRIVQIRLRMPQGLEQVAMIPAQCLRKVTLMPFRKNAGDDPETLGLCLRQTPHGGLQMETPVDGTEAAEANLSECFGQWLTHVGDTHVTTIEQFTEAEGLELRFEKRVTLPYEFAKHKLEEKVSGAILMSDLRIYIVFVVFFVIFFLLDRDVEPAFYVTQNMREPALGNEIPFLYSDVSGIGCGPAQSTTVPVRWEKTYNDLANAGDWNAWVLTMALASLWGSDQFGPVVSGNILLGAVRFRVIRMKRDSCSVNSDIIPNIASLAEQQQCYGIFDGPEPGAEAQGGEGEDPNFVRLFNQQPPEIQYNGEADPALGGYNPATWTQYRQCEDMNPDAQWNPPWTTGQINVYHCGGYFFELPWYINGTNGREATSLTWAQNEYRRRACHDFFDDTAMRLATMELMEYSPTFDTFLSTRMFFEVAAGGAWVPTSQFRTFAVWTDTATRKSQTIVDFFFLMCVLYYVGDFFFDARRQYRRKGRQGGLLGHFLQAWTILEFLNLTLFLASYGFRFTWWARCLQQNHKVDVMMKQGYYPGFLDEIEWLYMMQVYINSCNVVFTFLKLLKYMRLNKRFGILTETLADCQDSIIGVLIIFILVVLAFAVTGNTLFGTQMYEFRSLSASFSTLMRMLMGEFDYEAMKRENRVLAGLFFWSFLVLGLFVLLNFLIGVIAESFGKVSEQVHTEPLDMVFKKTADDLRVLLQPKVVKHYLRMRFVRCHTRETLLESCIDAVDEWRDSTYEKVPDEENNGEYRYKEGEETECQIINKLEFMGAIRSCGDPPGIVLSDIGEDYVGYIWNHLVYEFRRSQEVDTLQNQMRKQSAFQKGCKNALADKLRIVEQFSTRMEALKVSLEHMKVLLVERGAM